jgi:hypothetical protein
MPFNKCAVHECQCVTFNKLLSNSLNISVLDGKTFDTKIDTKAPPFDPEKMYLNKGNGRALIINNYQFHNPADLREGWEQDEKNLKELLQVLRYNMRLRVNFYNNLTEDVKL